MSSHDPYNLHARFIPSVVCTECGNNAHIVRREVQDGAELQTFKCAVCGIERQRREEPPISDKDAQAEAEQLSGVGPQKR